MKKSIYIFVFILITVFEVDAQKSNENVSFFSIGAEVGFPSGGSFSTGWGTGFGASAKLALPLSADAAVTASAGYISYGGKSLLGTPAWGTIPLKAGLRYKIGGSAFNIEPQIGYTIGSIKDVSSSEASGFTWAFGAGYFITPKIDLAIRYESYKFTPAGSSSENAKSIGLRLGYNF
jgi:opacity protein-like surface antigen